MRDKVEKRIDDERKRVERENSATERFGTEKKTRQNGRFVK
jgi:hypothetical protein